MIMNPVISLFPKTEQTFHPAAPGPSLHTAREKQSLSLMTTSCHTGIPLEFSVPTQTPHVTGAGFSGLGGVRAGKDIDSFMSEMKQGETPAPLTITMMQTPFNCSAAGLPSVIVKGVPQPFRVASGVEQVNSDPSVLGSQHWRGVWSPDDLLQAPPTAVQLACIFPQERVQSGPHDSIQEENLVSTEPRPLRGESSCNPTSVYENYRRWQSFKSLARRHYPQSPDTEAFSCFLIPVLRSLARLKPTMSLEEGLCRSVHEWKEQSNSDHLIYYKMAAKFMEFESEEKMQPEKMLQQNHGFMQLPPPAPMRVNPRGPSATDVRKQPVLISRKSDALAQPTKPQPNGPQYLQLDEKQLQHPPQQPENQDQAGNGIDSDPGLLSYIDKLCSQEDFVTKVEAVIHPQFIKMLLSSNPKDDPFSLIPELEEEERLTLTQLVEKRLLELKGKEDLDILPGYDMPPVKDIRMESQAIEDGGNSDMLEKLRAELSASPQLGPNQPSSRLRTTDAFMFTETSPFSEPNVKGKGLSEQKEGEEELPSLDFLLASPQSLLPCGLPRSALPASRSVHHGGQGSCQSRAQARPVKRSHSEADPRVHVRQPLVLSELQLSLSPKRGKQELLKQKKRKKFQVRK